MSSLHPADEFARVEQTSLFKEPPDDSALTVPTEQINALRQLDIAYQDGFIGDDEERDLILAVDDEDWMGDLRRRVQHYGFRYDYAKRRIGLDDRIGDLPGWVVPLAERLCHDDYLGRFPDQLIVNEYEPGQGIAPHIDRDCFGPRIAAISLAGDCLINLTPARGRLGSAMDAVVKRRSLMVYRGLGRKHYLHGIAARKSDEQRGVRIPRRRRISLTFRTLA
ncbi:alpha-ketoglutarate-dependent dioxygenase AlkB [Thioalkalivibrio sp. HK1]|uniref:alpha-ketoglutarate-dependent dioxygenase AlkB n=1 Tax=Thioalkalivibrio sp. HK1 TaxID=1469245 RepID=UPI0004B2CC24|nr:alpha-ketoglutarate-dependent dioxygenase AlkB [Thioalkalivibrio sp. HK1]